ncbi:uncharacterized protein LOC121388448 [Gigantopelta aegis]|uniref:uncharacterized protein LOC121388448 n=1 Tax=Gigantopelta aegis TaxID=1735272 RepID=UPI001B88E537|nr:uncharacterized protein LOC121388448 [Gigantopelta aegis]
MILKEPALIRGLKWLVLFFVIIIVCLPEVSSRIRNRNMSPKLLSCYKNFANVTLDRVVGSFLSFYCESAAKGILRKRNGLKPNLIKYMKKLTERIKINSHNRTKRQANRCVRKEYRKLTTQERNDYHRAVNGLKKNTIVEPNVYDALAMIHSEMQIYKAHGGPCFLSWHRVYLLMYEMALGDEVPGVCVPYWDSSLDNELEDPAESYMFSPELMGNGDGAIKTGPFGGWRRPPDPNTPNKQQAPVLRNVGADGELYSKESIEKILSRHDHSEIIAPNSDPDYDIEVLHGGVHMFIGGDMEALETAPFDPIFFMHHAFVDYIWELFRSKLRNQFHIDPSTNYPNDHDIEFHGRDEMMDIANFTCGDGYSDELMATVEYETSPTCTKKHPTCDSPFLRCQPEKHRCIPITLNESPIPVVPIPDPVTHQPIPVSLPQDPVTIPINPVTIPLDPVTPRPNPVTFPADPVTPRIDPVTFPPLTLGPGPVPLPPGPVPLPPGPVPLPPSPVPLPPGPVPLPPGPVPLPPGPVTPPTVDPCAHIEREKHNVKPCQNSFCINGVCDVNQWVYVPVKVVTLRPPGFNQFKSFPVVNGDISSANDIYQPGAYERTKRIIEGRRGRTPKGYSRCHDDGVGQIFVQSQGLNYDGVYKESAIVDQRLATTMSIAYLAVKDPGRGISLSLFRAADSCGRVCHTSCKNPRTGAYEQCSGVVELDSRPPLMYSKNYGDATLDVWDYGPPGSHRCPTFETDKFFLTFYCDYRDHLPWVEKMTAPTTPPMLRPRPQPVHAFHPEECRVSKTCTIDVPCYTATRQCTHDGEAHKCRGSCGHYVRCNYGHYKESYCSGGRAFNVQMNRCSNRPCRADRRRPQGRNPFNMFSIKNYMRRLKKRMRSFKIPF